MLLKRTKAQEVVPVESHQLAVQSEVVDRQTGQGTGYVREPGVEGFVVARPQIDAVAVAHGQAAKAIELPLEDPA